MRQLLKLFAVACPLLLVACEEQAETEEEKVDQVGDTAPAVAEAPTISLEDVAGTWSMQAMPLDADTVDVEYQLIADPAGWTLQFPDRDPIPVEIIEVAGDSIVTRAGPYESVLRSGVPVTVDGVWRLDGDRLTGNTVARYETTEADSVVQRRATGTRTP